jgi:hypothetical protein
MSHTAATAMPVDCLGSQRSRLRDGTTADRTAAMAQPPTSLVDVPAQTNGEHDHDVLVFHDPVDDAVSAEMCGAHSCVRAVQFTAEPVLVERQPLGDEGVGRPGDRFR